MRSSYRVSFTGGNGEVLAGIVDRPSVEHPDMEPVATKTASDLSGHARHPVVVFSHCFTCNKDLKAIVRVSRAMAEAGIIVLRYDMTGLGGSGGDFSRTNFTTNLADLRAAIDFANRELGPVTGLLGHSFGGAASLALAGQADSQLGLLSDLAAVATLAAPADTQHLATLMEFRNPSIASHGSGEVEIGGRRWLIRREMLDDFRSHTLSDWIARIQVPLMILHSPVDETVGFDQALRIYQLAAVRPTSQPAPPVSLIALDGADHLLANNPLDLTYVAELLSGFFRRHRFPQSSVSST